MSWNTIVVFFTGCILTTSQATNATRFNIGMLFDFGGSNGAQQAAEYKVEKYNNKSLSSGVMFKLSRLTLEEDMSDTHKVTKAACSIISRRVFLLYGELSKSAFGAVESLTRDLNMPYVTYSPPSNTQYTQAPFILHMRPDYSRALVDVVRYYKWPHVFYVYDSEEGLQRLHMLYNTVQEDELKIEIESVRLVNVDSSYAALRYINSRNRLVDKRVVLDLSTDERLQSVLKQIILVGMNTVNYHYLLGGLAMEELNLTDFQHGGVNITGFRVVNQQEIEKERQEWAGQHRRERTTEFPRMTLESALTMDGLTVIVDGLNTIMRKDQDAFRTVFSRGEVTNAGEDLTCEEGKRPWVIGEKIMQAMKGLNFRGLTGYVKFDEEGYRVDYTLDVMQLILDDTPSRVGGWMYATGLSMDSDEKEAQQESPRGLANNTFIITTIRSPPYLMIKEKQEEDGTPLTGNDMYEGYCADLARELAKICKFSYVLREVEDGNYGTDNDDGTWNGMVGELIRGVADVAIAPLTINSRRERVIDFSKPFMNLGISIMIKKPEKEKPAVFSFMFPLSTELWIYIIIAYLSVSSALFIVSRFSPYEWQIEDSINGPTFTNDFTLLNSLWFALGAFMRQGCGISPRSMSGRIVGSAWWFFTLILISSYTANLAAFLTVERMLTPIESADDLSKQTEIQYGTLNGGSTKDFFKNSNVEVYKKMWNFMKNAEPSVFVNNTPDGVERVRNSKEKYAFLLESTMNEYYNQRKPCNTMKVGANLDSKGYGIATPLHSDLRNKINLAVLKLLEDGVLQKLHKKWWYDKGECNSEAEGSGSSQSALTLSHVAGIFYILIGGLGVSMIVSLLEFLYKSKVEAHRQKKALANSFRNKARLATQGIDHENGGYTYTAPAQVISYDSPDYYDTAHTQV